MGRCSRSSKRLSRECQYAKRCLDGQAGVGRKGETRYTGDLEMGGEPDDGDRAAGTSVERDEWTISGQQIAAAMLAWGLAFARYSCAERATLYAVLTQVEVTDEEPLWPLVCRRVGERELAEIAHIDSAELRRCWKQARRRRSSRRATRRRGRRAACGARTPAGGNERRHLCR